MTGASKGRLYLRNLKKEGVETIKLSFSGVQDPDRIVQVMQVSVHITDDTHRYRMEYANGAQIAPDSEVYSSAVMKLSPSGTLYDVICTYQRLTSVVPGHIFHGENEEAETPWRVRQTGTVCAALSFWINL